MMYPTETKKYFVFEFTEIVYLKDKTARIFYTSKEYEGDYCLFCKDVKDWNRQGQMMKARGTLSNVRGYDYFITADQDERNKNAKLQRKEVIPWKYYLQMIDT